jgi:uncharacterized HAD superfamily protein
MLTAQEKTLVDVVKNEEVSTFYYRLKVSDPHQCAYDFDGIFCEECPSEYKGSDDLYYKFLCTANPLYYPDLGHVPLIITGRHQKYRDVTEKWLKMHNIGFCQMIMRDFDIDPADNGEAIGKYKAKLYKMLYPTLFIESRLRQAKIIHGESGKPVFCPVGSVLLTKE